MIKQIKNRIAWVFTDLPRYVKFQIKYERNPNVPSARFDIIEPDRKMSILHAILRKEFTSGLTMQDVSFRIEIHQAPLCSCINLFQTL